MHAGHFKKWSESSTFMGMFRTTVLRLILAFTLISVNVGCDKDEAPDTGPTSGNVTIRVTNLVDSLPLQLGQLLYSNAAGNQYEVDMLRYYLTNVTFIKSDGSSYNTRNYDLVNEEDSASKVITLKGIPNGEYTSIRFLIGIDSTHNNGLDQTGDLDPIYGMYWYWSTDYIFYKHEGFYMDNGGNLQPMHFHMGTAPSLTTVSLPASVRLSGNSKTIDLHFDLNASCSYPNVIDFNIDNNHQSTDPSERGWIDEMRQNISLSFRVASVQ